jgi:hypothetical protein
MKENSKNQLTLDLSFADNSPYFSIQEDSKFRNTLTEKMRQSGQKGKILENKLVKNTEKTKQNLFLKNPADEK